MRSGRWSDSACSGLRWATKIWLITTSCATIRRWRCWPASCRPAARIVRRWPGKARSTGSSWAALSRLGIAGSLGTAARLRRCLSICFWKRTSTRRSRSSSTWMPPTIRCTAIRKAASFTVTMIATAICRCTFTAAGICWRQSCAAPTSTRPPGRSRRPRALSPRSAPAGRRCVLCGAPIWGLPAMF